MKLRILIVDDEQPARYAMAKALTRDDYEIAEAADGQEAVAAIRNGAHDLVFLDLSMPVMGGQAVLREIAGERLEQTVEIIIVTADDHVPTAIECIKLGASDYINKPYEVERLRSIARRVADRVGLQDRVRHLQHELEHRHAFGALVGASRPMRELFRQIERVAATKLDVLIEGETGTGKELIARELHRLSARASGPFVAVNTAAIAETLAESELFGHVRGAFTGADKDRRGCFEQAHGGTLFLDEIGDMPQAAQTKMLRTLQERVVQPVGSERSIPVDVRVISATHQDLEQSITDHVFRQDLYFRIKGVRLDVPPLRQRREDILILADFFLQREMATNADQKLYYGHDAVDALLGHRWPGNVRELEHCVVAAAAMCINDEITARDLQLVSAQGDDVSDGFAEYLQMPLTEGKARLVEAYERRAIAEALERHQGNVSASARELGIHRQSLQQKITQLGIQK